MSSGSTYGLRVLYVEDEETPRQLLANYLQKKVKELVVAEDGQKGINKLYVFTPDVLITDYQMPNKNGLALIKAAKELLPNLKTVITTAHSDTDVMLEAIELGVDKFLLKPIRLEALNRTLKDFSEAVCTKAELERTAKSLKEMVDAINMSAIVSKADLFGQITYVNDYFCEISGYTRDELIGKNHNIIRHPDTPLHLFKELWESILSKKIWRGRIKNRKKNGDGYIVETTIVPIVGDDGRLKEFFSFRTDVTETVNVEQRLAAKEKEHLERLNKAKDDLLVVFTHELRTPLNAIINLSSATSKKLSKQPLEGKDEILEYMEMINLSGKDMLEHITSMIDIIKLKTKKMQLNIIQTVISDILRDVFEQHKSAIEQNSVICDFSTERIEIPTDGLRFKQIADNLISNAIKYCNGRIAIRLGRRDGKILFSVEDNGGGFKDTQKIGELFEQNDEDVIKRSATGLGVGLALCKLLCQELKYELTFSNNSSLGGAAVFMVIEENGSEQ